MHASTSKTIIGRLCRLQYQTAVIVDQWKLKPSYHYLMSGGYYALYLQSYRTKREYFFYYYWYEHVKYVRCILTCAVNKVSQKIMSLPNKSHVESDQTRWHVYFCRKLVSVHRAHHLCSLVIVQMNFSGWK